MCFNLGGILSSGCSTDNTVKSRVESLNQNITNILSRNVSTVGVEITNLADLKITIDPGAIVECDSFNVNQSISSDTNVVMDVTSEQVDDIISLVQSDIESSMTTRSTSENEMLSQALNTNNVTDMVTILTNIATKNITRENINSLCVSVFNKLTMIINIGGHIVGTSCTFDQNILVKMVASQIIKNAQKTSLSDTTLMHLYTIISTDNTASSKGLNSIIDSIMSFFKQFWLYILVAVVVFILIAGYLATTPAGQKSIEKAADSLTKV